MLHKTKRNKAMGTWYEDRDKGHLERIGEEKAQIFRQEIDRMILGAVATPHLEVSQNILAAIRMLSRVAFDEGIDMYEAAARIAFFKTNESKARQWLESKNKQSGCA